MNHERATLRDADGIEQEFDLWTTCFTARELRLMAAAGGLVVESVSGVAPGKYGDDAPRLEHPELLLIGAHGLRAVARRGRQVTCSGRCAAAGKAVAPVGRTST